MIAPCCRVCERWGEEAGGTFVQFKITDPKEIAHNELLFDSLKTDNPMFSHPAGNWFFCNDHIGLALKYNHLTWNEAESSIKKDFENGDIPKAPVRHRFSDKVFRLFTKN